LTAPSDNFTLKWRFYPKREHAASCFNHYLRTVCQLDFAETPCALAHRLNRVAALVNGAADYLNKTLACGRFRKLY